MHILLGIMVGGLAFVAWLEYRARFGSCKQCDNDYIESLRHSDD